MIEELGGEHEACSIHSLYWDNVDSRVVEAQKNVFLKFGYTINQHKIHGKDHGEWIDDIFSSAGASEILLIVDIDCIPLSARAMSDAIAAARAGKVFGCAQSANHIDSSFIYAGPMFLALSGEVLEKLPGLSMQATDEFDVGGRLTYEAIKVGIDVELVYPSEVAVPKWLLGNRGVFGAFTVYESNYLHLFESRSNGLVENFISLAENVCSEETVDYRKYVIRASEDSHNEYAAKVVKETSWSKRFKRMLRS